MRHLSTRLRMTLITATVIIMVGACTPHQAIDVLWPEHHRDTAHQVVWRESRYDHSAKNPRSSACGLFQLLRIHEARANRLGFTWDQVCNEVWPNAVVAHNLWQECGWGPWTPGTWGCRPPR